MAFREDLRDVDQVDDLLAQARRGHLLEFDGVAHGRHVGDELPRGLDMELLLGGAGAGAARQPGELLAREVAALRLSHISLSVALHALQHVCGVAAFERVDHAVVDLPHRLAHLVEEPAVVGDEQQRPLPFRPAVLEMFGKPVDCHDVQMVGGLVEREDVPILEQQPGQVGAASLASGQRADAGVEVDAAQQRLDDLARLVVGGPLVILAAFQRGRAHGGVVVQRVALVEHAERQSAALGDSPGIRLLSAFEQVQQRGFAVAVAADDADAIALEYALRHIGEDGFGGEGE